MSDSSDDDWFTKDINELTSKVKIVKAEEPDISKEQWESSSKLAFMELSNDYGGSYSVPEKTISNGSSKSKSNKKTNSTEYIQKIPLTTLHRISTSSSLNLFLEISIQYEKFFQTLNEIVELDRIVEICIRIINKICKLPLYETKRYFLKNSFEKCESFWMVFVVDYIKYLLDAPSDKIAILVDSNLNEFMENIIEFMIVYTKNIFFDEKFLKFIEKVETTYNSKFSNSTGEIGIQLKEILNEISEKLNGNREIIEEIYPTLEELRSKEVIFELEKSDFLNEGFTGVDDYLKTHLALLKEDFTAPLRTAIKQFKENTSANFIHNIRIYRKCKLCVNIAVQDKYENLQVNINAKANNINIKTMLNSKKLMQGNLILLTTSEKFNDLIIAVITNRSNQLLEKELIQIDFIKIYNVENIFNQEYIMLESDIFFEPYHHVYNALKNIKEDEFPLKSYIIHSEMPDEMPEYINTSTNKKIFYNINQNEFDLLDFKTWPSSNNLNINDSQLEALRSALTKKVCVIQGPPGTGKTFIGLQIVSALLKNVNLPILIVCQTNNALDQFLTMVLKVTTNIVRLGMMSRNPILDKYNIYEINTTHEKIFPIHSKLKSEYSNLLNKFKDLQKIYRGLDNFTEKDRISKEILLVQEEMRSLTLQMMELKQLEFYYSVKSRKVIGMTTTCAARYQTLLKLLQTPIVIVEETAQTLESHVIAALTKKTQQLILIGDHQQLRPHTNVYELTKKYDMDVSLFERMIRKKINFVQLSSQHRMRPEIANLIRPFYDNLSDHESVFTYPDVRGMQKNLFFIDHEEPESDAKVNETTKSNPYEVDFILKLCEYLIKQSYKPEEITILTMYLGQFNLLTTEIKTKSLIKDVKIYVVDNYQGYENRIILLSLVRSNKDNVIGYVGTKNRVCVALSRAREGLYVLGNMTLLKNTNWKKIIIKLKSSGQIDSKIPLMCTTHENVTIAGLKDFDVIIRGGGCLEKCNVQLDCKHFCDKMCHGTFYKHSSTHCTGQCKKNLRI